jgi:hypothetical protein
VSFEAFTAVMFEVEVFLLRRRVVLWQDANLSGAHAASIFRMK